MKKKLLSLLLAIVMVASVLPVAVFPVVANDGGEPQPEESSTYTYDDLYVRDADGDGENDIAFLWDAFDVTEETVLDGQLLNRVEGGANVTYDAGKAVAHNGFMTFYQIMAFGNTLSTHPVTAGETDYIVDEDSTFELLIAQDPTVQMQPLGTAHVSPVNGTGYREWGVYSYGGPFAAFDIYVRNTAAPSTWNDNGPMDASYGYISNSTRAARGKYGTIGVDWSWYEPGTINFMGDNFYGHANNGERRMFGAVPGEPFAMTSTVKYYLNDDGYTGYGHVELFRNGAEMSPFINSQSGSWVEPTYDVLLEYTAQTSLPAVSDNYPRAAFGHEIGFAFYAVRLYNTDLTEEQIAQNHFADLLGYHDVPISDAFLSLAADKKAELYASFATTALTDTNKAELEEALANCTPLTYGAHKVLTLDGYQARLVEYPAIRALFTVDENALEEGATIKAAGVIVAIAEGNVISDLTVTEGEKGYEAPEDMDLALFYDETGWVDAFELTYGEGEDAYTLTHVAYEDGFVNPAEQVAENYIAEKFFRGFVVVTIDDVDYVCYTDMTGAFFPEGKVSLYELCKAEPNAEFEMCQQVVQTVDAWLAE